MPAADHVSALIRMVEEGRFLDALREFYSEDATMQENNEAPRMGRALLLEREEQFLDSIREIPVRKAESYVVDGDRAAINWIFEVVDGEGKRRRLDEVAYQLSRDGRIVRERFYYDPAQRQVEV